MSRTSRSAIAFRLLHERTTALRHHAPHRAIRVDIRCQLPGVLVAHNPRPPSPWGHARRDTTALNDEKKVKVLVKALTDVLTEIEERALTQEPLSAVNFKNLVRNALITCGESDG